MNVTLETAAALLLEQDDIVILTHRKPDGDTVGSAIGLYHGLEALGKRARVECADELQSRYQFLMERYIPEEFAPRFVVAVDVASADLLGSKAEEYPAVHLCVDHHKSNSFFAEKTCLDSGAAATAEIVFRLLKIMNAPMDTLIANALFTGITTDTGCFRYANVTAQTHYTAADLISLGAEHHTINKLMFDSKSRGRLDVEKLMMDSLRFFFDGRCAIVALPEGISELYGVSEEDLDGVSAFPRRIEGVLIGVTIRSNADGSFRISLRTDTPADASRICSAFGGGGHTGAAGCTMHGSLQDVQNRLLEEVRRELEFIQPC